MSFFHCTSPLALLQLHALLFLSCCSPCILRAAAAADCDGAPPASPLPPSSNSACMRTLFSPLLSHRDNSSSFLIDDQRTRNLTLFDQSSVTLNPTDHSSSRSNFNFTYPVDDADPQSDFRSPSLAFIILTSSPQPQPQPQLPLSILYSMELKLICICNQSETSCNFTQLDVCEYPSTQGRFQIDRKAQSHHSNICKQASSYDSLGTDIFRDEVKLTYDGDTGDVHVQVLSYRNAVEIDNELITITEVTNGDGSSGRDDTMTLFVGYITSVVNIDNTGQTAVSGAPSFIGALPNDSKPNTTRVVLWVVVGVAAMILLIASLVLAFSFIKHHIGHHRRPTLVTSRPLATGRLIASPSTASRTPFPHHRLGANATSTMIALPPSPPYKDDFHLSGTASWLKQPNPR